MTKEIPLQFLQIYLKDETPAIGAGWRIVFAKIGPKWTKIMNWATLDIARVRTQRLFPTGRETLDARAGCRPAVVRRRMLHLIGSLDRPPTKFEIECLNLTNCPIWNGKHLP